MRRVLNQPAMAELSRGEIWPGIDVADDAELFRQREAGVLSFDEELLYTWNDVRDGAPTFQCRPVLERSR